MRITQALYDELIAHAEAEAPLECCGLIATDSDERAVRVLRGENAAASEWRYELDGTQQMAMFTDIADAGEQLGAIYHSHTHAAAFPSPVDVENAHYPDVLYVIVGLEEPDWPEVHAFRIAEGLISEVALDIERG